MHRLLSALVVFFVATATSHAGTYTEPFTTTTYRDASATTAVWDTAAGSIHLPSVDLAWIGGRSASGAKHVLQAGNIVVLDRGGSGVELIDVTNPLVPSLAGSITYSGFPAPSVMDIAVTGTILYVSWGKVVSVFPLLMQYGVDVYSISDPTTPLYVQTLAALEANGLTVHGNRLYVATGGALSIWDITDPAFPVNLGSLALGGAPEAVAVAGNTAFVAAGAGGMHVVDVTNPAAPVLRATVASTAAEGVDVDGDLAAVALGVSGVNFYDVSVPTAPALLGSWSGGEVHAIRIDGDVATLADGSGGVVLLDIADPTGPVLVESDASITTVRDVTGSGTVVFAAHDNGLAVYSSAQTPAVALERSVTTGSMAHPTAIRVSGNYAYMADGVLRIFDASRTAPLDSVSTWGSAGVSAVDVDGSLAYVDALGTFTVLDVSNPSAPTVVGSVASGTFGAASDIVASGDLVFVSYEFDGLYVFDVSNPAAPTLLDSYPSSNALDVDVSGATVFLADVNAGLRIISAANPSALTLQATYAATNLRAVVVSGKHAFVGSSLGGITVLDVGNPSLPVVVGNYAFGQSIQHMAVSGNILLAAGSQTAQVIDIVDPANPVLRSSYAPGGTHINYDIAAYGNMAYLAEWFSPSEGQLLELRVFDRGVQTANNMAQSTTFASTSYPVVAMRMTPASQGSISWKYSTDDGAHFYPIVADGSWQYTPSGASADLRWQAKLSAAPGQPAPVCTSLDVEWRGAAALITSIADVPADEGGQVQVDFLASGDEFVWSLSNVASYDVYRLDVGGWVQVASVAPTGANSYAVAVPTQADSTLWDKIHWTSYRVRTVYTPAGFADSPVDSGYSVDNTAPQRSPSMTVAYNDPSGGNRLQWDASPSPDVKFYRIHRDVTPGFTPTFVNAVDSVAGNSWVDPAYNGWAVYYVIEAVDSAGNASIGTKPDVTTDVDDRPVPSRWALGQNVPNPFNPATTISFAVPEGGGNVTLTVFDVTGHLVATLFNRNASPGIHRIAWNGRDRRGRRVSSGVYFYRLHTPSGDFTRKMTLVE